MPVSFPIAKPLATPSRAGLGGPKSAAGKARSAANAVKHGLSSANPVILEFETVEAWEAFRDTFTADLHPQGAVEEELARELALTQWRRRRLPAYEARCADRRLQTAIASLEYYAERESQQELEERARVTLPEALLPNTEDLTRLLRYESHLDRKFTQTLRHLHRLQQTRKQEAAPDYKTNSAPHPPVPATSVPPVPSALPSASVPSVPSVPSQPTAPLSNPPAAEKLQNKLPTCPSQAGAASPQHSQRCKTPPRGSHRAGANGAPSPNGPQLLAPAPAFTSSSTVQ